MAAPPRGRARMPPTSPDGTTDSDPFYNSAPSLTAPVLPQA
ncbi:hypothetical protein ACGFY7_50235 [Streptomyces prunicolor]